MRNGEGGTVPSYNVQLLTDTQHGIVVNVEATTDAIDYRQMKPALERCATTLDASPNRSWPTRLHQPRLGAGGRRSRSGLLRVLAE